MTTNGASHHAHIESAAAVRAESDDASDSDSDSSLSSPHPVDLGVAGADGWEDAESDHEQVEVRSLFDERVFSDVKAMLDYCNVQYGVDLRDVVRKFELDFYACVRLINYIRSETSAGNVKPDLADQSLWAHDRYLQPVLEDDAVLFGLDELLTIEDDGVPPTGEPAETERNSAGRDFQGDSNNSGLRRARAPQGRLHGDEYLKKIMKENGLDDKKLETDADYFGSYSYNDIHETMLKDEVRTSAYRDFLYDYKHLVKDRHVLDIGCGTGILSMFAAKAGARHVFAADNSSIIEKAKQIVADNALDQTISCVKGLIETVDLPWDKVSPSSSSPERKVDIIVSEWMGYCLLYEAMLDSVLWARDRYLDPQHGLMVPSHCTLHIAPFSDPEYLAESIGFWNCVYGFDMSAMTKHIYEDIVIRPAKRETIAAQSAVFRTLPLHTMTLQDLEFEQQFQVVLDRDIDSLDGWVIWFDTFMLPGRGQVLPADARADAWDKDGSGVAFTTGPHGPETHWKAGMLIIDHRNKKKQSTDADSQALKKGQVVNGSVRYGKLDEYVRGLEVEVAWDAPSTCERGSQIWKLR